MARYNTVQSFGQYPETVGGGGSTLTYPVFPVINDAPGQVIPNAPAQLGDSLIDKFGNVFLYVRAIAALAAGQVCKHAAPTTGTVSATGTGGDNLAVINTNITTTRDESLLPTFLVNANATRPGIRLIKGQTAIGANTQFTISKKDFLYGLGGFDADKLTTAWVSTDVIAIVRPYTVDVAGAGAAAAGIAMGTVTAGYRTLVQVSGLAQVLAVGTTDALVAGGPVFTIAAGAVKGVLGTPTATEAELDSRVGISPQAYSGASAIQTIQLFNLADKW